ncbi:hypothetical protein AB5J72_31095 [Streptomyces sp. CG1]|uniref:hypothetical protein n=1 Tax=Streptomyces sp. CG1 TaxID=1287523 RepID=UPI0034E1AD66
MPNLCRDPSLRLTEPGRTLLHPLTAQSLDSGTWRWLATGVPVHRRADVVRAARRCAEQWLQFAGEPELRGGTPGPGRAG